MIINKGEELTQYTVGLIELIEEKIEKTWRMFILSNFDIGMNTLVQIFNDIDLLLKNIVNINFKNKFKIDIEQLFEKFAVLEDSMKIQDYVMIADLIKYEIKPTIEIWKVEINKEIKINLN